ncbi:MAG: ABC transporter ATP-binding protein [Fimbriimonadaceae bacterium]|nr:ABC transporter ATP-binding protein [Fimbriimonadaceae bacterium]
MTANSGLHVHQIEKRYGNLVALRGVSATFRHGSIHAVLGENGAGKSTLMGVMSGFVQPDLGTVSLDGRELPVGNAAECRRRGIEMIHQHFTLVSEFTVAENLALARLDRLTGRASVAMRAAPALAVATRLGWQVDGAARVRDLSVGEQQRIEILKALGGDANVIIFDEPTAVLSPDEVQDLFRVLRQLRDEGKIVVLIAHKLAEVMEIADEVTVLRRGTFVAHARTADVTEAQLAEWMVGELPVSSVAARTAPLGPGLVADRVSIRSDRGSVAVRELSFTIARGEILGFGGVDGNGQLELAEAMVALRPHRGALQFDGQAIDPQRLRIAYVPQDRHTDGLALNLSIADNMLIGGLALPRLHQGILLKLREIDAWAADLIGRFAIKADRASDRVRGLSGGNQQKVVVSRALVEQPDLLVAVNPTRGLDLRATQYVHEKIREARNGGAAVALITTDLDELYALSDRTAFLSRGELNAASGAGALVGATA